MRKARFMIAGILCSLLLFSSSVFAVTNADPTTVPSDTVATQATSETQNSQASEKTEDVATLAAGIPVPEETKTLVTKQDAPGAGWILLAMIVLPLAIGFIAGWYVNKFVQKKKAEAYASDDEEDQEEEAEPIQETWSAPAAPMAQPQPAARPITPTVPPQPVVRPVEPDYQPHPVAQPVARPVAHNQPQFAQPYVQPMEPVRQTMQPVSEPIPPTPPQYEPVVLASPPLPKLPDPIPDQIDDWGNPYFYDDKGIPYYFDPATHERKYYEDDQTE